MECGENKKAVKLLNDPKIGPLTLVRRSTPRRMHGKYDQRNLQVRTAGLYGDATLDKAEQTMNGLESLFGRSDDATVPGRICTLPS